MKDKKLKKPSQLLPSDDEKKNFVGFEGSALEFPDYSADERDYIKKLRHKLMKAKNLKDEAREEFDYESQVSYFNMNERYANTTLNNKQNKGETMFQSGSLRTKMMAFVSVLNQSSFGSSVSAFDRNNIPLTNVGNSLEDAIEKTEELENFEEKKLLMDYELLKQGTIFVEDICEGISNIVKTIASGVYGKIKGVKIDTVVKDAGKRFERRIINQLSVYLGNYREYFVEKQPYLFTAEIWSRERAREVYGEFERWKYVHHALKSFSGVSEDLLMSHAWRLTGDLKEDQVERIVYQSKFDNEIQVILNGVPMLPMGYPLTSVSPDGEYTIVQQNLEPIRHDFAIGKSFTFKNKNVSALIDEMMKLGVLKTQKSFLPPRLNLSGRIVTSKVFMPAQITRGIGKGELPKIDESEGGVTPSELAMISEIRDFYNQNTQSEIFLAASLHGKITRQQQEALQKQAKVSMAVVEFASKMLLKKLTQRRLVLILKNWFDPMDKKVDDARKVLVEKYHEPIVKQTYIGGRGMGARITIFDDTVYSEEELKEEANRLRDEYHTPITLTALSPKLLKNAKITWLITITEKPKKTSDLQKLMFHDMVIDAMNLKLPINPEWLTEKFAQVWEEDPGKMFQKAGQQPPGAALGGPEGPPDQSGGQPGGPPAVNGPVPGGMQIRKPMMVPGPAMQK